MSLIANIVIIGLGALFLSIPLLNSNVFHTINVDQIIVDGRESLAKVEALQSSSVYIESSDSARVIIERFRNDPYHVLTGDIIDWRGVLQSCQSDTSILAYALKNSSINQADSTALRECPSVDKMTSKMKFQIVGALNTLLFDPALYVRAQNQITVDGKLNSMLRSLTSLGIMSSGSDGFSIKEKLTLDEKNRLQEFGIAILSRRLLPALLQKDPKRGTDWASEFITQTAYYYIGSNFRAQMDIENALKTFDTLLTFYPKTVYAEVIFLDNGRLLFNDGKNSLAQNQIAAGEKSLNRAISYLQKIEMNREIAREFPKYKYTDLHPGMYVNVDAASKAKSKIKEKTSLYTQTQAKADIEGKNKNAEGGNNLEDAIKLIGECYTALGQTDSARMQYRLILDYFPESDNLAPAQKLIADSYVRDGDLIADGTTKTDKDPKIVSADLFRKAVSEYLKFINVYPQSSLISEVYIALGDIYYKLNDVPKAASTFAMAIELAKTTEDKAKVQLKIGNYYYDKKQYPQAIKAYEVILKNFLGSEVASNAQYLMGECEEALGDTSKAIAAYQIIVEHYKRSSFFGSAAFKIGNTYYEKEDFKNALEAYKLGITYDPDGNLAAKTQFQVGMVWKSMAKQQNGADKEKILKDAILEFQKVVSRFFNTQNSREADQASYQIADCYLELGNEKSAREAATKISSRDLKLSSVKLFGVDADNTQDELKYWEQSFNDALEDEERASALYEKALILTDKLKDYNAAFTVYNQILDLTKDRSKILNARIGISRVYLAQEKFTDAQNVLAGLLTDKKLTSEIQQQIQIQLYDAYFKGKEFDKAFEGFESFVAQYPDHAQASYALYRIASVFQERKEYQKALDKLQIIIDKYPESTIYDKAVLLIGTQMVFLEQPQKAVDYLSKYIKKDPQAPAAVNIYLKMGEIFDVNLNKKSDAVESYTTALTQYPDDPLFSYVAYKCGMVIKAQGEDQKAIAMLQKAKKEDKSIYRAAQSECGKLIAKRDPQAAIANYRQIVAESETPEDSATALVGIGDVYGSAQKYKDAAATYEEVYRFYHGQDTSLQMAAIVKWVDALMNAKQYSDAIKAAKIMQEKFPNGQFTINTIYFEAAAYFSLQNYTKARETFGRVIKENKSDQLTEIAYYQKAECLYFAKDFKSASNEYADFAKRYPQGKFAPRAFYMQGNVYWQLEDFASAKKYFEKVVTEYPEFDDICNAKNFLAFSLNRIDRWKEAVKYYDQVIKNSACSKEAEKFAKEQREAIITAH